MSERETLKAEWTSDCQGKQDYDAPIVELSTRYWPRGGGFSVWDGFDFKTNSNQDIKPSAHASIILCGVEETVLAEQRFEGESEPEVKMAVEEWAQKHFAQIAVALVGRS